MMTTTNMLLAVSLMVLVPMATSRDRYPGLYKRRPRPWLRTFLRAEARRIRAVRGVIASLRFIRTDYDIAMGERWCRREPIEHFLIYAGGEIAKRIRSALTQEGT